MVVTVWHKYSQQGSMGRLVQPHALLTRAGWPQQQHHLLVLQAAAIVQLFVRGLAAGREGLNAWLQGTLL